MTICFKFPHVGNRESPSWVLMASFFYARRLSTSGIISFFFHSVLWFLPHLGRCLYIFFPSVFSIYRSKFLTTYSRNKTSYRIIWLPRRISNHLFSFLLSYSKSLSIRLSQSIQGFVTLRLRYRSTVRTNPSRNSPPHDSISTNSIYLSMYLCFHYPTKHFLFA